MNITVRIKYDPTTENISAVEDGYTKAGVTTASIGDTLEFVPDDPATEVVVFFCSGPQVGAPSPFSDAREPMVLQKVKSPVKGPSGRYRYSCVVNTLSGMKKWPGGGGEVEIPTGRR